MASSCFLILTAVVPFGQTSIRHCFGTYLRSLLISQYRFSFGIPALSLILPPFATVQRRSFARCLTGLPLLGGRVLQKTGSVMKRFPWFWLVFLRHWCSQCTRSYPWTLLRR